MKHPFQRLLICPSQTSSTIRFLLAAAGPYIYSFNLQDGSLLGIWPEVKLREDQPNGFSDSLRETKGEESAKRSPPVTPQEESEEPLGKKSKLSHRAHVSEINSAQEKSHSNTKKPAALSPPDVIKMVATTNERHVVAVTGHDKCIRVFELQSNGTLKLLSERCMTKRPSSIVISSDDESILCADKFGDVYLLPLLVNRSEGNSIDVTPSENQAASASKKAFVPAATHLTVHTARNQRTLQEQLKRTNQVSEKTGPTFAHQLLLGHVSMLTDIAHVTLKVSDSPLGKLRGYIITSDRDEHIRVSRGQPQAYVIENYCLGHTDFVSKICIPNWRPTTLISGGGDDHLILWDWLRGQIIQKVDLIAAVHALHAKNGWKETPHGDRNMVIDNLDKNFDENAKSLSNTEARGESSQSEDGVKIAVSGIWTMPRSDYSGQSEGSRAEPRDGEVLVTCESIPAVLRFDLSTEGTMRFRQTLNLSGNPLDIAICESTRSIIVTIDNAHETGSTRNLRSNEGNVCLQKFVKLSDTEGGSLVEENGRVNAINLRGSFEMTDPQERNLPDLLYGVRNLRKRGNEEDVTS